MTMFDGTSNPFNTSHPDPELVRVFRGIRSDARSDPKPTKVADMAEVSINFDGAGQPLIVGMGGYIELPFSCRIMGARLLADAACSASVDLHYGTFADYPSGAVIYDTIPALSGAQKADLSVTGWHRRLVARDVLQYGLTSFSGSATRLTLALWVRKIVGPSGALSVTDGSGATVTDNAGNVVSIRS